MTLKEYVKNEIKELDAQKSKLEIDNNKAQEEISKWQNQIKVNISNCQAISGAIQVINSLIDQKNKQLLSIENENKSVT